jgi:hypothetical protein
MSKQTQEKPMEELMTATVFAKRMNVSYTTAIRWLKRDLVPGAKLRYDPSRGNWWEIPESALKMERPRWGGPKGGTWNTRKKAAKKERPKK